MVPKKLRKKTLYKGMPQTNKYECHTGEPHAFCRQQ